MSKITVVALVAALFLVSCGEAPPVHSEAEPERNTSRRANGRNSGR